MIAMPAGMSRTRSGWRLMRVATSTQVECESNWRVRSRARRLSSGPTMRRTEVALPPTATARSGRGRSSGASTSLTCAVTAASSRVSGGSPWR